MEDLFQLNYTTITKFLEKIDLVGIKNYQRIDSLFVPPAEYI